MNKISFTSRIRLVSLDEFFSTTSKMKASQRVDFPWTVKQSVLSDSAYTTNVLDCTVCGLTDGSQVLLNHICPTNSKNFNFTKIKEFISRKIDLENPGLQGFILGAKLNNRETPFSAEVFERLEGFMEKNNIPYSKFKGGLFENHCSYSSAKDEWLIGNCLTRESLKDIYKEPMPILNRIFDEVKISPADEISW